MPGPRKMTVTQAQLQKTLEPYPTKKELQEELGKALEPYPTREELRQEYPTKEDLRQALEAYPTRAETNLKFDILAAAIAALSAKLDAFPILFAAELARHVNAANEEMRTQVAAVDDKYEDLPGRVTVLEQIVKR